MRMPVEKVSKGKPRKNIVKQKSKFKCLERTADLNVSLSLTKFETGVFLSLVPEPSFS